MSTLEIRHQISVDTDTGEYILKEMFGAQPPQEWKFTNLDDAKAMHVKRQKMLMEMVASISPEAREAVEDARHVDNLKHVVN